MTEAQPEHILSARRWLGGAEEELRVVDVLYADDRVPFRPACFHAHLAAEKALKAVVLFRRAPIPKIHDLVRLRQLCTPEDQQEFDVDELGTLDPWAIEGRYPEDIPEPTREEVLKLAECARRVVDSARSILAR